MNSIVSTVFVALSFVLVVTNAAFLTTKIFSGPGCTGTVVMQSGQSMGICSITNICTSPYTGVNNNFPGDWSGRSECIDGIPSNPFGVVIRAYTDQNCSDTAGFSAGWYGNDTCIPNGAGGWMKYVCNGTAGVTSFRCTDNTCSSCSVGTRYTWPEGQDHKCYPPTSGGTYASYIGCHATVAAPSGGSNTGTQPKAAPTPTGGNNGVAPTSPNNNRSGAVESAAISLAFLSTFAIVAILL
eukprot:TRINITY_DN4187_c0_g1_i1.p1 TRINITY_DN4187_c0_g1~~TRINITY_DN4187_c0_g1_i1.p1  ORF type:complete len:240 (-),score=26.05 TRINITY_DN4187_c0_g1_i1:39-758(-)